MPVLLLTGELDKKFCDIARSNAITHEKCEWQIINDVGHAIHVEDGEKFGKIVSEFLSETIKEEYNMTVQWETIREYEEILYEKYNGIAKVSINRPHVHNAFTPKTVTK